MSNTFSQAQKQSVREQRRQDSLDVAFSLFAALTRGAQPNACFDNVLDMFLKGFPDVFSSQGCKLVEGWYVIDLEDEIVVNEHGWCEFPDGRIIDPTVVMLVSPDRPVYYFPGVERSWQEVKAIVQKKDVLFPYVRGEGSYGEDGLGHPDYKAAYEAATQKVFSLANAGQPPKRMTFLTAQDGEDDRGEIGRSVQAFIISPEPHEEGHSDE